MSSVADPQERGKAPGQALMRDVGARWPLLTHLALTTHAVGVGHHTDPPLTACVQECAGTAHTDTPADVLQAGLARRTEKADACISLLVSVRVSV